MVFPFVELVHFVYRAFLKTTECTLYKFFVIYSIGEQVRHYHSPSGTVEMEADSYKKSRKARWKIWIETPKKTTLGIIQTLFNP